MIGYPSWKRYSVLAHVIANMRVRDKRQIFINMREMVGVDHNTLLPSYGITCGEFAVFHILMDAQHR